MCARAAVRGRRQGCRDAGVQQSEGDGRGVGVQGAAVREIHGVPCQLEIRVGEGAHGRVYSASCDMNMASEMTVHVRLHAPPASRVKRPRNPGLAPQPLQRSKPLPTWAAGRDTEVRRW